MRSMCYTPAIYSQAPQDSAHPWKLIPNNREKKTYVHTYIHNIPVKTMRPDGELWCYMKDFLWYRRETNPRAPPPIPPRGLHRPLHYAHICLWDRSRETAAASTASVNLSATVMNHAAGAIVIPLSLPQHLAPSFSSELSRLCVPMTSSFNSLTAHLSPPPPPHSLCQGTCWVRQWHYLCYCTRTSSLQRFVTPFIYIGLDVEVMVDAAKPIR